MIKEMSNSLVSWLTIEGAAEHIGVKKSTIYSYVSERRIPYHKNPTPHPFLA